MLKSYDSLAITAWEKAKVRAHHAQRPLSLGDLWWGVWATLYTHGQTLDLPDTIQQQLAQLGTQSVEQKVRVSTEVSEFHEAIQKQLKADKRATASVWDILLALLDQNIQEIEQELETWKLDKGIVHQWARERLDGYLAQVPSIPPEVLRAIQPFTINLTEQAAQMKLSRAYERDEEREAILQILLSKRKRNVALVGPAGVGKTKLVEDLALRIYQGEIPALRGCIVLMLNLVGLRAGTSVHGDLEKRMESLRRGLEEYGDRIILFIDELHTIVGTSVGGHVLDVANALKPLLASGAIRCIGATTQQEYAAHIETDPALARRFQSVVLQEPSREVMQRILDQVKGEYEAHHQVIYPAETLDAIIELSNRFMPMRHFPDKAIEVLDLAGA